MPEQRVVEVCSFCGFQLVFDSFNIRIAYNQCTNCSFLLPQLSHFSLPPPFPEIPCRSCSESLQASSIVDGNDKEMTDVTKKVLFVPERAGKRFSLVTELGIEVSLESIRKLEEKHYPYDVRLMIQRKHEQQPVTGESTPSRPKLNEKVLLRMLLKVIQELLFVQQFHSDKCALEASNKQIYFDQIVSRLEMSLGKEISYANASHALSLRKVKEKSEGILRLLELKCEQEAQMRFPSANCARKSNRGKTICGLFIVAAVLGEWSHPRIAFDITDFLRVLQAKQSQARGRDLLDVHELPVEIMEKYNLEQNIHQRAELRKLVRLTGPVLKLSLRYFLDDHFGEMTRGVSVDRHRRSFVLEEPLYLVSLKSVEATAQALASISTAQKTSDQNSSKSIQEQKALATGEDLLPQTVICGEVEIINARYSHPNDSLRFMIVTDQVQGWIDASLASDSTAEHLKDQAWQSHSTQIIVFFKSLHLRRGFNLSRLFGEPCKGKEKDLTLELRIPATSGQISVLAIHDHLVEDVIISGPVIEPNYNVLAAYLTLTTLSKAKLELKKSEKTDRNANGLGKFYRQQEKSTLLERAIDKLVDEYRVNLKDAFKEVLSEASSNGAYEVYLAVNKSIFEYLDLSQLSLGALKVAFDHQLELQLVVEIDILHQRQHFRRKVSSEGFLDKPLKIDMKPEAQSLVIVNAFYELINEVEGVRLHSTMKSCCVTKFLQARVDERKVNQLKISAEENLRDLFLNCRNPQIRGPRLLRIDFETTSIEKTLKFTTDGDGNLGDRIFVGFRN